MHRTPLRRTTGWPTSAEYGALLWKGFLSPRTHLNLCSPYLNIRLQQVCRWTAGTTNTLCFPSCDFLPPPSGAVHLTLLAFSRAPTAGCGWPGKLSIPPPRFPLLFRPIGSSDAVSIPEVRVTSSQKQGRRPPSPWLVVHGWQVHGTLSWGGLKAGAELKLGLAKLGCVCGSWGRPARTTHNTHTHTHTHNLTHTHTHTPAASRSLNR